VTDTGWMADDLVEDDIWDDDPYGDDEPDEPDWGYLAEMQEWQRRITIRGRERRRLARHVQQDERLWRKRWRHRNDRFWSARNDPHWLTPAFDDGEPF
jgi:hypothetical protein